MPWIIGIDEAGYGPNLGPFVMTSTACHVPEELADGNLWQVLERAVRRYSSDADGRLIVEDSKLVYSTRRGLCDLERGVLAFSSLLQTDEDIRLSHCVDWLCPAHHAELRSEPWYVGSSPLPVAADKSDLRAAAAQLENASRDRRVRWGAVRSVIVCPARFNQVTEQWGSKGAVLALGLAEILRARQEDFASDAERAFFFVDKHGGRNRYSAILQQALPDGLVVTHREGMEQSVYSILGLGRELRLSFEPRADGRHFCVALASMVSKYLREVLMLEFNRFWEQHVPGLKPTAGYPGDSARFFAAIRPALDRMHITEPMVWRRQ